MFKTTFPRAVAQRFHRLLESLRHAPRTRKNPNRSTETNWYASVERLENRALLSATAPTEHYHPAGVDFAQGTFDAQQMHALEHVQFDSALSSKTSPSTFTGGGAIEDGGHELDPLTFVLDFNDVGQANTTDIFGNEIATFDVTSYGFLADDFDMVAESILAEVDEDFFTELIGTVAGPSGQDLAVDFIIGDIGTAPAGRTEYYYVQIGSGIAGPHSGGTLGVAGGSVVRNDTGTGPNFGITTGDVVASVFTDAIVTLSGLSPSNALTSGNLTYTTNAISGTLSHEVAHTLSLSHINKAGSVQPTPGASPIMGTGAIDLPNNDRIGDREFSLSGVDGQNSNAPRAHIQQLVDAVGLHDLGTSEIHGQKWNDLDGDGVRDLGEPGLNGWVIELYDVNGVLIGTQTTADMDLDTSGTIDPETERGLYSFTTLAAGSYTVGERMQPGWIQTSPGGGVSSLAGLSAPDDSVSTAAAQSREAARAGVDSGPDTIFYDYVEDGVLNGGRVEVDPTDPHHAVVDSVTAASQWSSTTLVDNGPTDNRIDIVLVGDGYTSTELGTYATQAAALLPELFGESPLDAYEPFFNVHRVDVISNESGVDHDPTQGVLRDTALGMGFWCSGIERLLCVNVSAALSAAADAPDVDQVLALANSSKYGGAGYAGSNLGTYSGGNAASIEVALHEFGHSFADLADEYDYADGATYTGSEPGTANVSTYEATTMASQQEKWHLWLDEPNVDTFEGAQYNEFGIYRPTSNSLMRSLGQPFEQINTEQFVLHAYETVRPIDDATPTGTYDDSTTFFVDPVDPTTHDLDVQWYLDGVPIAGSISTTLDASSLGLAAGTYTLSAKVVDNTDMVRDETLRDQFMTETRSWTLESDGPALTGTHDVTLTAGQILTGVDFGNVLDSSTSEIHGQKWNDLDGDGVRDPGEPGLNGWVIQLYDDQGVLLDTTVTADVDLDNSNSIDPETERGLYSFTQLAAGTYTVSEVQQPGWIQTSPGGGQTVLPPAAAIPILNGALFHSSNDSIKAVDDDGQGLQSEVDADLYFPPQYVSYNSGDYLSEPADGDPLTIALEYLRANAADLGLVASDLEHLRVTNQYDSDHLGVTHIYLRQTHGGLDIHGADININISSDGRVINVGSTFLSNLPVADSAAPQLSAADALESLADVYSWTLDGVPAALDTTDNLQQATVLAASGVSITDIPAVLQYVPTATGVELAWNLNVQTLDLNHWYDASVSATDGRLLASSDWVDNASYHVFATPLEHPDDGGRTIEVDPHDVTASPFGWHDTDGVAGAEFTDTRGNNVFAQEDTDANNTGGFRPSGGGSLVFDFPLNLANDPSTYQSAAITNLFYWNNILHDVHYAYGFDEASGNFQQNNYGNGGIGGDPVQADAQDGLGTDNANFATPPDGFAPRMQQFIFTSTIPNRDSDLSNGIIIHEYGHGVSNRLTGGAANSNALNAIQSGGMGEGWSDWWALMLGQKPSDGQNDAYPIGTYVLGQATNGAGIRRFPYSFDMSINPHTYATYNASSQVHNAGEIWASALWDLNWLLINGDGGSIPALGYDSDLYNGTGGNNLALQLVMDGLKLQPANPSFLDARDAILMADTVANGGANHLAIWTAFARRGMGFSAFDGGSANATTVTEAFDLPATSEGTLELDKSVYEIGESVTATVRDSDLAGNGTLNITVTSSAGDTETLALTESGSSGVFSGTINTVTTGISGDGVLRVANGGMITATYQDADDGTGSAATVTDQASIVSYIDLFTQDFESGLGAGETLSGGFTINNTNAPLNNGTLMMGHPANHSNNEYSYYEFSVDLTGHSDAQLVFEYAAHIEDFYDRFNLLASTSSISPPLGLITPVSGLPYENFGDVRATQLGQIGYDSGGSLDTGVAIFDLSAFDDDVVNIRMQFGSDISITNPGINIDNVRVRVAEEIVSAEDHSVVVNVGQIVTGVDFGNFELPPPEVTLDVDQSTITEAPDTATFTATLEYATTQDVTIDLGFTGTATLNADYSRSGTQIVISAGNLTGSVTVTSIQDSDFETAESIIVDIASVTNATEATPQQATTTIVDDEGLGSLNGSNGFRLDGDQDSDFSGFTSSGAGDFNGDGFDDIIVGARLANPGGVTDAGATYIVFGKSGGFTTPFDLSSLNGTNGFRLDGVSASDSTAWNVSGTGDINNDGFDDIIISARFGNGAGSSDGAAYVVLGASGGFSSTVNLSTLNGTNGFRLEGPATDTGSGWGASGAGDINNDGLEDLLISTPLASPGSSAVYIVFGTTSGFSSAIDLTLLNGTNGFRIDEVTSGDDLGAFHSVSAAGDFNADGFDDLILGARKSANVGAGAGNAYILYGAATFSSAIALSSLNGTNGFRIDAEAAGDELGMTVNEIGDINADGIDDVVIGARLASPGSINQAGSSYVLFGATSGLGATFSLTSLDGTNGFRIDGAAADDQSGLLVNGAGDINADGFDDIIVGARLTDPASGADAGSVYLIYGSAGGFSAALSLASLSASTGFQLDGENAGDHLGRSSSTAGDVNGDGFDDALFGADFADPNGTNSAGSTYVLFGSNFNVNPAAQIGDANANTINATQGAGTDILIGGQNDDTLISDGGDDVLRGGEGDDGHVIPDVDFSGLRRIQGGNGFDTLLLDGSGLTLDLTTIPDNRIVDIEEIDITGTGSNTLTLDLREVLNISTHSNTLIVRRDPLNDTVNIGSGWTQQADENIGPDTFEVFTQGAATLKIQSAFVPALTLVIADPSILENGGSTTATVSRGVADGSTVTVNLSSDDTGEATVPGSVDILPGETTSDPFTITAVDDFDLDGTQTVTITATASGFTDGTDTVDVTDDEVPGSGTLIGIDLGGGSTPTNWNSFNGSSDTTLTDLTQESGATTAVDVFINVDSSPGGSQSFTPSAGELPTHTQSLTGIDGSYFDASGNIELTFSDLTPGQAYEIYVFGGNDIGANHMVTITGQTVLNFNQNYTANQLFVNDELGDSGRDLSTFAELATADGSGEILVRIAAAPPGLSVAAVAIREADPATHDFGDAPSAAQSGFASSYAVTLAEDGARHLEAGPQLGDNRDLESDGIHSANADADDTVQSPDDEDGVTFLSSTILVSTDSATTGSVDINLVNADLTSNRLDAWIDWNRDGDWDDSGEQIFANFDLGTSDGVQTINFAIPQDTGANVEDGATYARFRLSTAGGLAVTGEAADGEVEDYQITVQSFSPLDPPTLSSLNGSNGFRLDGEQDSDFSGFTSSSAGDFNGDGFDDIIVGARLANPGGVTDAGATYIVFGKSGGFTTPFDLSSLNGTNGFRLDGVSANDSTSWNVGGTGDINNDGFDDIIISSRFGNGAGSSDGAAYVVLGASGGFSSTVSLSTLNGSNGFRLEGPATDTGSGWGASGAGDINNDGLEDLLISTPLASPGSSAVYVVFGTTSGFSSAVDLTLLNGTDGFRIDEVTSGDDLGSFHGVSAAGDFNADGFDDLILGARKSANVGAGAGNAYILYGGSTFSSAVALSSLNGTNGFRIDAEAAGDELGMTVNELGDINADGIDDVVIGARLASPGGINQAGASYVLFGATSGFGATFSMTSLNGTNGFRIDGVAASDQSGLVVNGAGDINADGFDDITVAARLTNPASGADAGSVYLIYGAAGGFSATLSLSSLTTATGFQLDGENAGDHLGRSNNIAGDINGDGFDDLLIGADLASPGGMTSAGSTYVVFGNNFNANPAAQVGDANANTINATQGAGVDILIGGLNDDTLISDGGDDVLRGGEGDDGHSIPDVDFSGARRIQGGNGFDTLLLDGSGLTLDLTTIPDNRIVDIEQIDITGTGPNTLTLDLREVLNISTHSNTLIVRRDPLSDTVNIGSGWTQQADETIGPDSFEVFTQGAATLKIQQVAFTLTVAIADPSIEENGGTTTATVTRDSGTTGQLIVTLSSSDTGEATVPPTVTIEDGQTTSEAFTITGVDDVIVDGTQTVTITASAAAHINGTDTVDVTDDDVPTLTVDIAAASISEADGPAATTVTVTRNTDTTDPMNVVLTSDDTTEATIIGTATILAGHSSVTVDLDAVDDLIVDGTQTVTITATELSSATTFTPDTSFGTGGLVVSTLRYDVDPQWYDMELQSDGKIIAIGRHPSVDNAWRVMRLNTDGSLDSGFGSGGIADTTFTSTTSVSPDAVELLPDGRIMVLGSGGTARIAMARYTSAGLPDTTFDGDGMMSLSTESLFPPDFVANPDGSSWVIGTPNFPTSAIRLTRVNADGSLGTTTLTDIVNGAAELGTQITKQADGKLVVAGVADGQVFTARYNTDGSIDTSYNGTGISPLLNPGSNIRVYDIAIDADGNILVVGSALSSNTAFVARYTPDGLADTSFSGDGLSIVSTSNDDELFDISVLPDGKLLLLGSVNSFAAGDGPERAIFRMNNDGSLDTTFDSDGIQQLPTLPSFFEKIRSGLVQPDGKLVTFSEYVENFRIQRFEAGGGLSGSDTVDVTDDDIPASAVTGRHLFYDNSSFDEIPLIPGSPDISDDNDNAIATDKTALMPGTTATFANYSGYSRGINGIMVDISSPPGTITEADFEFKVGNTTDISSWSDAPAHNGFSVEEIDDQPGTFRVTFTWPDGAITNQWLQVTVLANENTGLSAPDVHYWGNQVGETGNSPTTSVDGSDVGIVVNNPSGFTPADVENPWDVNKSGFVDGGDVGVVVNNPTGFTSLILFAPNPPPVLSPIGNQTVTEGNEVTFTAMATDASIPTQTLTFTLDPGAPGTASIHPDTGAFSWTPGEADGPGSVDITVRVTDDLGVSDFETITITVLEDNQPPVLDPIANQAVVEGNELTFTATASDNDLPAQTLTFTLDPGAPGAASIHPDTGVFSWTPGEADGPGSVDITVRITDDLGASDFETITLTILEDNQAPVLDPIGNQSVTEGNELTFTATASDNDLPGQTLTFTLDPGAPGAASIHPDTGVFSWTPGEADGPDSVNITVRITDDLGASDFETITVDILEDNQAPVLDAIGNQTVTVGSLLTFTASASDTDLPSQTLTYSLDSGAPANADIDPNSGEFTWTPPQADGLGSHSITVRVTDSLGASDFETINVDVVLPQITVDGNFSDWATLPSYTDPVDDQHDTDHDQQNDTPSYVDHPDVDLVEFKFTHDSENLYAYFRATGNIGATQDESDGNGRAGRYYVIVTIDVDDDDDTGYWLHEGGYYPTTRGYDMNMEAEFYDGELNTVHYLSHDALTEAELTQDFVDLTDGNYVPGNPGPYPVGTATPAPGNYDNYTQWVYHPNDTLTLVEDKGPVYTGIASVAISPDGHELEMVAPFLGFLTDSLGNPNIALGHTIDISFSLEASGELSNEVSPTSPNGKWASDTADPINGYVLFDPSPAASPDQQSKSPAATVGDGNGDSIAAVVSDESDATPDSATTAGTETAVPTQFAAPVPESGSQEIDVVEDAGPSVAGRHLFYNDSYYDSPTGLIGDPDINASDDAAIDDSKSALMPGELATFTSYSGYIGGITGIMIDIANASGTITADDFEFRVGNLASLTGWTDAPEPDGFDIRPGAGVNGSDRVTFTWPNGAIRNEWLEVTVLANENTGLTSPDVHYWGNQVGETGNSATTSVDGSDVGIVVNNPSGFTPADVSNPHDVNKSGFVDGADVGAVVNSPSGFSSLLLFAPTIPPVLAPIGDQTVTPGSLLTFTASATDDDVPSQTLVYSLDPGAPAGASIDSNSGVFTWTPLQANGVGSHTITVRVTDSLGASDFETIDLDVVLPQITVDGDFSDWATLPSYTDPVDDQHDTDHDQQNDTPSYVDHPDVDLVEFKFTHDEENLYAYFRATGNIGATQDEDDGNGRAGRYYVIVTIDVDNDDDTGYWLHEGGYFPTTRGYDMNMEAEFYNGELNTVHYLSHDALTTTELNQDFVALTDGNYVPGNPGPYPVGTATPAPGNYDNYTQWVYHSNDTLTLVEDRGPVYTGIAEVAISADGHELEMVAPFLGFLTDSLGNPNIALGHTIDISFSLEASGELSNEVSPTSPNGKWASDTADPINGYVLFDPTPNTALDTYVTTPDPTYDYSFDSTIVGAGYTAHVLDLKSQTWLDDTIVQTPEWQHWVTVIVPDGASSETAILHIDSGSQSPTAPTGLDSFSLDTALQTGQIVVNLPTVPNQPQEFLAEGIPRTEDEIISYTYRQFLDTGDESWPLLLPMVKSAVAAMDAAQDYASSLALTISDFIVTGASKRGWTTWLTAAVDSRVKAIAPMVIDVLNIDDQMVHHHSIYSNVATQTTQGYASSIHDYVDLNVVQEITTPMGQELLEIVDPYEYRDRLTMPKYLVNATGDEFFVPDSGQFYLDDLEGPTYVRYVPNAGHGLNGDAATGIINFFEALEAGSVLPTYDWTLESDGQRIRLNTVEAPVQVRMWQATNLTNLDFRMPTFGANWTSSVLTDQGGGEYVAQVTPPVSGGTAFFIEMIYSVDGRTLTFTTEVSTVTPVPAPVPVQPVVDSPQVESVAETTKEAAPETVATADIEEARTTEIVGLTSSHPDTSVPSEGDVAIAASLIGFTSPENRTVFIEWGDGSGIDMVTADTSGDLTANHIYLESGIYTITIAVQDQHGNEISSQTQAVVARPDEFASGFTFLRTNSVAPIDQQEDEKDQPWLHRRSR